MDFYLIIQIFYQYQFVIRINNTSYSFIYTIISYFKEFHMDFGYLQI
jgi:hypothetical protein